MKRLSVAVLLFAVALASAPLRPVRAEDEFLASLSKLATRTLQKEARGKKLDFSAGPLEGQLEAVEPDERLAVIVTQFELADDLVKTSATTTARVRVTAKASGQAEFYALVDVKVAIVAEARFVEEGEQVFIAPVVKDAELTLTILEILPADLAGGEDLFAGLAMALFKQNKEKILSDANQRIGKRPL